MASEGSHGAIQAEKYLVSPRLWSWLLGVLLLAGIAGGLYSWGRSDGREAQRKDDFAEIAKKDKALIEAAGALNAAAATFRAIDQATADSRAQAERVKDEASKAAREAARQRDELAAELAAINEADEKEKTTCAQAQQRVCGSPLH